jgi:hypothetical protein
MLCLLTPTMQNRRIIDAAFRRAGVSARVQSETDSILTFYTYVRYAGLFRVIPHSFLSFSELYRDVMAIPWSPNCPGRSGWLPAIRTQHLISVSAHVVMLIRGVPGRRKSRGQGVAAGGGRWGACCRCRGNMPFSLPVHSQHWYDGW